MRIFCLLFGVLYGSKLKFESKNVDGILSEDCQKDAYPAERVLYKPQGIVPKIILLTFTLTITLLYKYYWKTWFQKYDL